MEAVPYGYMWAVIKVLVLWGERGLGACSIKKITNEVTNSKKR